MVLGLRYHLEIASMSHPKWLAPWNGCYGSCPYFLRVLRATALSSQLQRQSSIREAVRHRVSVSGEIKRTVVSAFIEWHRSLHTILNRFRASNVTTKRLYMIWYAWDIAWIQNRQKDVTTRRQFQTEDAWLLMHFIDYTMCTTENAKPKDFIFQRLMLILESDVHENLQTAR